MSRVLRQFFMLAGLVAGASPAIAAPVIYAFSGTLSQPFDGTSQFSGTFTYDTSMPQSWSTSPGVGVYSSQVTPPSYPPPTLTFNIGDKTDTSFGSVFSTINTVVHTQASDSFEIDSNLNNGNNKGGQYPGEYSYILESIKFQNNNLISPGPFSSTALPSTLNLRDFNDSSPQFEIDGFLANGQYVEVFGQITTLTPLGSTGGLASSVPEPSTVLIILVMGGSLMVSRRMSAKQSGPLNDVRSR
jgi:hypothetical protein